MRLRERVTDLEKRINNVAMNVALMHFSDSEIKESIKKLDASHVSYEIKRMRDELDRREMMRKQEPEYFCQMCNITELPEESDENDHFILHCMIWHYDRTLGWLGEHINFCPNCGREMMKRERNE